MGSRKSFLKTEVPAGSSPNATPADRSRDPYQLTQASLPSISMGAAASESTGGEDRHPCCKEADLDRDQPVGVQH